LAALYFKGRFAASDQKDRMQIHTEAKLLGEKMHAKYPKNKKIMSLYAVNLSLWGKEYGPLQAVREGVAGRVRDLGDSAEDYQILGRAHQLLPYIPLLLNWPDKKMANHYLNLALVQHPEDLYNSLFVAELLLDQNRFEEALNIIDVALLQGIRPDYVLEDRRARWKLKYLREQVLQKMKNASQNFPF
jgi:tetratricopeptide (TPR) repeat protein